MPIRMQSQDVVTTHAAFARPGDTTAYASGDAIANSTTAASVLPMSFGVNHNGTYGTTLTVVNARLFTDSATAFGAIRLHLFMRQPFVAGGYQADNAALALTYAAMTQGADLGRPYGVYSGYIDFTTFNAQSSSAMSSGTCPQTELEFMTCASQPDGCCIFGLLQAQAAFTPANAQNFLVALSVRRN